MNNSKLNQTCTLSLKKYSIERAIETGNVDNMKDIYQFLTNHISEELGAVKIERDTLTKEPRIVHKHLKKLTNAQKRVLNGAMQLADAGETFLCGASIARKINLSQPVVSYHVKNIVKFGYLQRGGNRLYVCYTPNGDTYNPTVKRYPAMPALGYKMQDIAKITHINKGNGEDNTDLSLNVLAGGR